MIEGDIYLINKEDRVSADPTEMKAVGVKITWATIGNPLNLQTG